MQNAIEIQKFLSDLGINSAHSWGCLSLDRDAVDHIGGKNEVLTAITSAFGKGFFWDMDTSFVYVLKSIY